MTTRVKKSKQQPKKVTKNAFPMPKVQQEQVETEDTDIEQYDIEVDEDDLTEIETDTKNDLEDSIQPVVPVKTNSKGYEEEYEDEDVEVSDPIDAPAKVKSSSGTTFREKVLKLIETEAEKTSLATIYYELQIVSQSVMSINEENTNGSD